MTIALALILGVAATLLIVAGVRGSSLADVGAIVRSGFGA